MLKVNKTEETRVFITCPIVGVQLDDLLVGPGHLARRGLGDCGRGAAGALQLQLPHVPEDRIGEDHLQKRLPNLRIEAETERIENLNASKVVASNTLT